MRLPRPQIERCCVHVTHRCQERRFLLRFAADRRQCRLWTWPRILTPVGGDGKEAPHALRLPQSVAARLWR
ncbi:MAG: hypothetical protein WC708_10005 [Lentisphaeria bacterium]